MAVLAAHAQAMSRQHDREALDATRKTTKASAKRPPAPIPEGEDDLRSSVGNNGMGRLLDPAVADTIEAELGGGRPLAATAQAGQAANASDDGVRIHSDGTAAGLSRELGAVAFTFGRDIFLAGNAPDLASSDGQAVIRHELTHVDQQAQGGTSRPRRVSSPDSPAERQATRAQHGDAAAAVPSRATAVHRQEEEEEMLQAMPADTVHRHVPGPEEEAGAPAPANPALAALFDATVLANHRAAIDHLNQDPPASEPAVTALTSALDALGPLSGTYGDSDPLLHAQLRRYSNALDRSREQLIAIVYGPRSPEAIRDSVLSSPGFVGFAEGLRDQLH